MDFEITKPKPMKPVEPALPRQQQPSEQKSEGQSLLGRVMNLFDSRQEPQAPILMAKELSERVQEGQRSPRVQSSEVKRSFDTEAVRQRTLASPLVSRASSMIDSPRSVIELQREASDMLEVDVGPIKTSRSLRQTLRREASAIVRRQPSMELIGTPRSLKPGMSLRQPRRLGTTLSQQRSLSRAGSSMSVLEY